MLERGVKVDHSTINRWVVRYSPLLLEKFKKRKKPVGRSWRMDETYILVKGEWNYLYRALDKEGQTVDFMLSKNRDKKAATAFFRKSIGAEGQPEKVNMDKSGANKAGIDEVNSGLSEENKIEVRQVKYLNNIIEQDHRFVKKITYPMKGFKAFRTADGTLQGIELWHMIKKGQMENTEGKSAFEQFYALAA